MLINVNGVSAIAGAPLRSRARPHRPSSTPAQRPTPPRVAPPRSRVTDRARADHREIGRSGVLRERDLGVSRWRRRGLLRGAPTWALVTAAPIMRRETQAEIFLQEGQKVRRGSGELGVSRWRRRGLVRGAAAPTWGSVSVAAMLKTASRSHRRASDPRLESRRKHSIIVAPPNQQNRATASTCRVSFRPALLLTFRSSCKKISIAKRGAARERRRRRSFVWSSGAGVANG
jgi:hypothetical protein